MVDVLSYITATCWTVYAGHVMYIFTDLLHSLYYATCLVKSFIILAFAVKEDNDSRNVQLHKLSYI